MEEKMRLAKQANAVVRYPGGTTVATTYGVVLSGQGGVPGPKCNLNTSTGACTPNLYSCPNGNTPTCLCSQCTGICS